MKKKASIWKIMISNYFYAKLSFLNKLFAKNHNFEKIKMCSFKKEMCKERV